MQTNRSYDPPSWITGAIAYQIFPDRFFRSPNSNPVVGLDHWGGIPDRDNYFGGTLRGIIDGLDYLQELGVNLLYLTPIFQSCTNHRYDTVNYYEIDPMLGTKEDLAALVDALHQRNMRIILDGVFNHTGDRHPYFEDVRQKGPDSEYADWYYVNNYPVSAHPVNYQTCGGCEYLPKLNTENPAVRAEIYKIARYWIREFHIDGWRLDCASKISKDFWKDFYREVKQKDPEAYVVAELWRETGSWLNRGLFDGAMNYRLREILLEFVVSNHLDAEDFAYELQSLINEQGNALYSMLNLVSSHDVVRIMTACGGDRNKVYLLYALLFALPGVPMIYYGDEVGLPGGNDPDCRRCMIWDRRDWNLALFERIKSVIKFRKEHTAIQSGAFRCAYTFNGLLAFERRNSEEDILVIINTRKEEQSIKIPVEGNKWSDIQSNQKLAPEDGVIFLDHVPAQCIRFLIAES